MKRNPMPFRLPPVPNLPALLPAAGLWVLLCLAVSTARAQYRNSPKLLRILDHNRDSLFQAVLHKPDTCRVQIIYTRINRDAHNRPHFRNYYFHFSPELYFNPASTVKMPLAYLSLKKLEDLHIPGLDRDTRMQIDSVRAWERPEYRDSSARDGYPSIAQFIRKAFLVSDNDAYNRMYQFLGQQYINETLHRMGYPDVRIVRQFMGLDAFQNRFTNPVRFIDSAGRLIYRQKEAFDPDSFDYSHRVYLGKAHYDLNDSLIDRPMDFSRQNNLSLLDLQQIEQSLLFPESVAPGHRFNLDSSDTRFVLQYMSQFPSQTNYPKYDSSEYFNSYVKFYFYKKPIPSYVRIFNKVGWSYGFLTDISYIVDFRHHVEFMLSSTVYVNSDQVLNDDRYDYETVGHPFLTQLGKTIYSYELRRRRLHSPNLQRFRIRYEHRDPSDKRPAVKGVDN